MNDKEIEKILSKLSPEDCLILRSFFYKRKNEEFIKKLKEVFDDEEQKIYKNLVSSYGDYKADKLFVTDYKTSTIPSVLSLKRIRSIKKRLIEELVK